MLFLASALAGFFVAGYVNNLDRIVRARFEGRLFRVPSRVFSAPTILYPGLDWKRIDLRGTLERLGYRELPSAGDSGSALPVGSFAWDGDGRRVMLFRRAFEHPSRAEPARRVELALRGATLDRIADAGSDRELGAFFLEPERVGSYYGLAREQRDLVRVGDVPRHLIDAVLAVEDQRFMSHAGIDLRRILGAAVANLRAGGITQGGSTLTQQLVKNFFLTPERSYTRKANEAVMALLVEARYDKHAILESYLNEIYLGQRGAAAIHGVGEAARLYFGKSVRHLTLPESALIAAIIQSPNGLSPHREGEAAKERRDLVLRLMLVQGRIDETDHESAIAEPLRLAAVTPEPREARYFLDALRRQLPDFYGVETLTTEGLRIYSTLDLRLQRAAAAAVREELELLETKVPALKAAAEAGRHVQACLVALRPQTGEVLALVGGRNYGESQYDRCTQARRPAGSVFKPFVYVAALEPRGGHPQITLTSMLSDEPLEVATTSGPWRPANYDHEFHGVVPVREALEKSYNVAVARLAQEVGIDAVLDVAHRLGVESALPAVPSVAIGAADVSPLELARAYATLANGGIRPQIRTFEDVVRPGGGTINRQAVGFERVLDAGTAFLATSLLEGVVERGTGRAIRSAGIVGPIAGKTGTSDDEHDAWFVGYSPEMVVVVWVGFDEPATIGVPSSRAAVPIWARFFRDVTGGQVRGAFVPPVEVAQLDVHPASGALALAGCPESRSEFFLRGTEPIDVCPEWGLRTRRDRGREDQDGRERESGPRFLERLFQEWLDRL